MLTLTELRLAQILIEIWPLNRYGKCNLLINITLIVYRKHTNSETEKKKCELLKAKRKMYAKKRLKTTMKKSGQGL